MANLVGSLFFWTPKPSQRADSVAQAVTPPQQGTRSRPHHYMQETWANTLLEISIGLGVLCGALYGLLHLMNWMGAALKAAAPL